MNENERYEIFELLSILYKLSTEKQKEIYYVTEGAKFIAERERTA